MARPRKIQMDDVSVDPTVTEIPEEVVTPAPSFLVQIEEAVVETISKVETVAEEISEFISEQTKAEIEMGRQAMQKLLGR